MPVAGQRALCRQPSCQWTFNSTPPHLRCKLCERPLTPLQLHERICDSDACRGKVLAQRVAQRTERARILREQFLERATRMRATAAAELGIDNPEAYPLARVPRAEGPLRRLPAGRRAAYIAHLRSTASRVFAAQANGTPVMATEPEDNASFWVRSMSAQESAIAAHGCMQCRGSCCNGGGEHAYVDEPTIARYVARHPEADVEGVVAAYVSRLRTRTTRGACVNQGVHGCSLPREMRSVTCNGFYCAGIRELVEQLQTSDKPQGAFYEVAALGQHEYVFADAQQVRPVRRRLPVIAH